MKLNLEVLLEFSDLSFEKQEEIRNAIAESVRSSAELMDQIRLEEALEYAVSPEDYKKKTTVDQLVELRVAEVAMKNENCFKQYISLEKDIIL